MKFRKAIRGSAILCSTLALFTAPAHAVLGGSADTVQSDAAQLGAKRQIAARSDYQVHELSLASGTVVREYLTPAGQVFGLSWQGPAMPNLQQLLGDSFKRFKAAAQQPHGGHRQLQVRDDDLVIESRGRPRNFSGKAYLPQLMPANVSADQIQ
ncbi:MAG: DUF2844 domain-containing protein [Burkholderiaceae bacterium]|nr:DUF2844 domain-containing protein [Burkholderiaceae bacterium]